MRDKSILLVEDNPDEEALTLLALRHIKVENDIVTVHDGTEALEFLFCTGRYAGRSQDVLPGVVLLDLKLPGLDGAHVLRRIRADDRTRHLPVVVLTSMEEEAHSTHSHELGANGVVRKPVDFFGLVEAMREIKLAWLDGGEPPSSKSGSA